MSSRRVAVSEQAGWTRAALLEDGRLVDMAIDAPTDAAEPRPGAVVVGRVRSVSKALNAAFVDIGAARDGFLGRDDWAGRTLGEGDAVTVQVQSPPVDEKGAKLSLRLSLAGRTAVYLPGGDRVAVSARLADADAVAALSETARAELGPGDGCVVRTAAASSPADRLGEELRWLRAVWERIVEAAGAEGPVPRVLRPADGAAQRILRDIETVPDAVVVDDGPARSALLAWVRAVWPEAAGRIDHWNRPAPLFAAAGVDAAVDEVLARETELPSGGRISVERTRAAVTVDVDMGGAGGASGDRARLAVNLEAAQAIARIARARNLSGLIVVDFLKLSARKDKSAVLRALEQASADDPAGLRVGRFTPFGLVEMTRARRGPVLDDALAAFAADGARRG